jgi:hypothetical protein
MAERQAARRVLIVSTRPSPLQGLDPLHDLLLLGRFHGVVEYSLGSVHASNSLLALVILKQ